MEEETRSEAPKYRAVDALSGIVRHSNEDLHQINVCLAGGGHYWDEPEPGESYRCTRCPMVGARNWPTINECNDG